MQTIKATVAIRPMTSRLFGKAAVSFATAALVTFGPTRGSCQSVIVDGGATTTNDASTRYLLDGFEVEYLPSPAFLRSEAVVARNGSLAGARLLAVGYHAPGGEAELAGLREVWPRDRMTVTEGSAATEHPVKPAMAHFGIVHFAVHARADARDALASHLRLVADLSDDGFLHVNEIASHRLGPALVVLSACETDAGSIYKGEGVMGLALAFLASGAGSVVATQWPVGAKTAVLMREFYRRLAAVTARWIS